MSGISYEEHVEHVARESARFLDVLRGVPEAARVPSCPDWGTDDLLFHLTEVQNFWTRVVADQLQTDEETKAVRSERPADRAGLETLVAQNSAALIVALRSQAPETEVWTWASDRSVGFVGRRQAHEALIHRVDAELTAGDRTPLPPELAADGVREVLDLMYGGPPAWGVFTPNPDHIVRFSAIDTENVWTVTVGRFVGTKPGGGDVDVPCLGWLSDEAVPTAEVVGTAGDLDCWLWNREPITAVTTIGSASTLAALAESMAEGVQ